ncbi:putative ATPase [Saccharopolyspora erythraea NRRL 2338]|uniref:helix-turn-helix transcriptional regulator n=1 Tax=Saccharopolyspora erythraea TaxID=1836 RepID=UPI000C008B78|nr:LuxR family transcriptional regulator [Saccharopolyspora erythraea]PFG93169.1 putative ATPase [Saccharopolyspora erythraea NRRL 2338]QRK90031.1 AAA family ATPase [Saccharopolyspora erythraea]
MPGNAFRPAEEHVLHGRERERRAIRSILEDARSARGRALVLRGETGIGKSTLLKYAQRRAAGMRLLSCSGLESESELAFSGLQHLVAPLLDEIDGLPPSQAEALRAALGMSELPVTEFVVSAAVCSLLSYSARGTPLLVVVDDAQWLDRATLGALYFTARRIATEPIALLFGMGEAEQHEREARDLPTMLLTGLSDEAADDLLDELGWNAPARDSLITATGGNPLALRELTRLGAPEQLVGDALLLGTVPLSERLRTAFIQRMEGLPAKARALLLVVAVEETGRLGVVLGACARLGIDAGVLDSVLRGYDQLEITERWVRFRHSLMRSAAYHKASLRMRSKAHAAVAEELTDRGESDRASWHRAMAAVEPDEELATALERSADTAERRGGSAAVVSVLQRAAKLSTDPEGRTRRTASAAYAAWQSGQPDLARALTTEVMTAPTDMHARVGLTRLLGLIDLDSNDPAVACAQFVRGAQEVAEHNPEEALTLLFLAVDGGYLSGRIEDAGRAARLMTELDCGPDYRLLAERMCAALEGRLPLEGTTPRELLDAAPALPTPDDEIRFLWVMAMSWLGPHQRQAREFGLAACRTFRLKGVASVLPVMLNWVADTEYHLGLWRDGQAHAEEAVRLARDTGQRNRMADGLALLARFASVRGDWDGCRDHADAALETALVLRNRAAAAHVSWALGLADLARGRDADAYRRLSSIRSEGSPYANSKVAALVHPDLVEAAVRCGHSDIAEVLLSEVREGCRGTTARWRKLHLHMCRALVEESGADFATATGADLGEDRPFDRARAALLHGEWLRRNRRQAEARWQLQQAAELFDSLGAAPWSERARGQLRAARGALLRTADPAVLTRQEKQIAGMAATGMTNKEIAAQLSVSPRTVSHHLYKLFPKLGISSRAQLRGLDLESAPTQDG